MKCIKQETRIKQEVCGDSGIKFRLHHLVFYVISLNAGLAFDW